MTELEKMQVALFTVIRNSRVLPVGISKEKSMQEINKMSYETMQECIKMINFDIAVKYYQEGKQLCEAMESVQKWSDENSPQTLLTEFLRRYPKTELNTFGCPNITPCELGLIEMRKMCKNQYISEGEPCKNCWHTPINEESEVK